MSCSVGVELQNGTTGIRQFVFFPGRHLGAPPRLLTVSRRFVFFDFTHLGLLPTGPQALPVEAEDLALEAGEAHVSEGGGGCACDVVVM
jgi:hypothetical protein